MELDEKVLKDIGLKGKEEVFSYEGNNRLIRNKDGVILAGLNYNGTGLLVERYEIDKDEGPLSSVPNKMDFYSNSLLKTSQKPDHNGKVTFKIPEDITHYLVGPSAIQEVPQWGLSFYIKTLTFFGPEID